MPAIMPLGISILSHTGAVIGGIIAGMGYESSKSNKNS
jgi:hypothetical protein